MEGSVKLICSKQIGVSWIVILQLSPEKAGNPVLAHRIPAFAR